MTFEELFKLPAEEVLLVDHWVLYLDAIMGEFLVDGIHAYDMEAMEKDNRFKIFLIKNINFDGRRIWQLGKFTFDDKTIAVFKSSGREGRECSISYTSKEDSINLSSYFQSFNESVINAESASLFNLEDSAIDYTNFYGYDLETVDEQKKDFINPVIKFMNERLDMR